VVKSTNPTRIASNADIFTWSLEQFDMARLEKLANNWWRYCMPMVELTVSQQEKSRIKAYETSNKKKKRWIVRDELNIYFPFGNEVVKRRAKGREYHVKYEQAEKREERKKLKRERERGRSSGGTSAAPDESNKGWGDARAQKNLNKMEEEMRKFSERPKPKTKGSDEL
jgi:hypothetical protein